MRGKAHTYRTNLHEVVPCHFLCNCKGIHLNDTTCQMINLWVWMTYGTT